MFSLFAVSTLACLSNPESTTYNLTKFEEEILPKWIAQYQLSHSLDGHFSFRPGSKVAHPYATSDVAHVLCFTNQLDEVVPTESDKDAWAAVLNSFQRPDGFFNNTGHDGKHPGGSLWHAAGYVTAGLTLLGRSPKLENVMFERIASTPTLWAPTVNALLDIDAHAAPDNITSRCKDGYSCAQNIASLLSWFIQTNASTGGLARYPQFVRWYLQYLPEKADPATGLWCTKTQQRRHGTINCIGGSFHIDFVFQYVATHMGAGDGGSGAFPFPAAQLNTSLGLQMSSGGWSRSGLEYINVDGIYQATRPSLQLHKARWADVEVACQRLMSLVAPALNNEDVVLGQHSHSLPALVSAVAECQKHWPSMLSTVRPWKMCLDDVPYI